LLGTHGITSFRYVLCCFVFAIAEVGVEALDDLRAFRRVLALPLARGRKQGSARISPATPDRVATPNH
jgi:hypothetical protein